MLRFRRTLTLLAGATLGAAFAGADVKVQLLDGYGSGPGGEFEANITLGSLNYYFSSQITFSQTAATPNFITFCIERDETFVPGGTYYATISDKALLGGANTNAGDPIDPWTAYIYTKFATKTLSNYDYDNATARVSDATELQKLIWFFEQEFDVLGNGYNYDPHNQTTAMNFLGQFSQAYAWWLEAMGKNWTDIGGVRAMNTWDSANESGPRQSQLILIDNPVPAPAALVLGMIGLGMIGAAKRRSA